KVVNELFKIIRGISSYPACGVARTHSRVSSRCSSALALVIGRIVRVEADRFGEVGDGAIEIAHFLVRDGTLIVALGCPRFEPDRLVIVGNGAVIVALAAPRSGAVVQRTEVLRIEPDRDGVPGDGAIEVALVLIQARAVIDGGDVLRIESD